MEQERKQAMEKQESKKALSNFSTASTATDYNQLRGTDSEGKVSTLDKPAAVVIS
jgi:hypothetical protein